MKRGETIFGLCIFAFGALMLKGTLKLKYFVDEVPGPGFLPFWVSLGIIILGVTLTVGGIRSRGPSSDIEPRPAWMGRLRIWMTLGALAISLLLFDALGFAVTAFVFVAVVTFMLGARSWRDLVLVPLLAAAILHIIFAVLLKVPLPIGILSILG